jgi:hypothetical protein
MRSINLDDEEALLLDGLSQRYGLSKRRMLNHVVRYFNRLDGRMGGYTELLSDDSVRMSLYLDSDSRVGLEF